MIISLTTKTDEKSPIILLGTGKTFKEGACSYLCLDPNVSSEEHKKSLEYLRDSDPENVELRIDLPA